MAERMIKAENHKKYSWNSPLRVFVFFVFVFFVIFVIFVIQKADCPATDRVAGQPTSFW